SSDIMTGNGQARLVTRVADLGSGQWRYDYYVMNLEYAVPVTSGAEPSLRLLSNHGFLSLMVPLSAGLTLSANDFTDTDLDAANDWSFDSNAVAATWAAQVDDGNPVNPLNWGTMYRFSITASAPPHSGNVKVASSEGEFPVAAIVPRIVPDGWMFG